MADDYQTRSANTADQRTLGTFQLSVATSLAIESAVGIHPDSPPNSGMPITQFKALWVNLRTLYRNIVSAMSATIAPSISSTEIAQIMYEEMHVIPDMLQHHTQRPVKVVYYFNKMLKTEYDYPEADLRKDSSDKQKHATRILEEVMKILQAEVPDEFVVCDGKLPGEAVKCLIITHVPYDLLSERNFGGLFLLESHTGRIKPKALWYTKYYQGKTLSRIPFTEEMLQVFGDLETFHPLDVKLRKAIMEVAEKRNWSNVTTRALILDGIEQLPNPAHILKMKKIYKVLF